MYWHVFWCWVRQNRALCESIRFARYLVLQPSAGDPDTARSNQFEGDSLTSKIEALETTKAPILLREATSETKIESDGFFVHTS